jgi:hypothetical protein
MKTIELKSINGDVLFSHSCKSNTIRITLEEAVKQGVNLKYANLCKEKTIEEWDAWFKSSDSFETDRGAEEFKRIEANYKAAKAYLEHLNN